MGVGAALYMTLPALLSSAGAYFFHGTQSKPQEAGIVGRSAVVKNMRETVVKKDAKANNWTTKLAPEFDGLNCFETFIGGH